MTLGQIVAWRGRSSASLRLGLAACAGLLAVAAVGFGRSPGAAIVATVLIGFTALCAGRAAGLAAAAGCALATAGTADAAVLGAPVLVSAIGAYVVAGGALAWLLGSPVPAAEYAGAGELPAFPLGERPALSGSSSTLAASVGALTAGIRDVASGDLTKNLAVADGPLSELGVQLNRLIFGMREFFGLMHVDARGLSSAAADLHGTAATSVAVIEGGAIAQQQLEEGIVEQAAIVDGAQRKVGAMNDAITEVAGSAQQQTVTLDQTAASVTQMSASIEEVAAQVESLLTISSETSLTADRGNVAIHTIVGAMTTIRGTIDELAGDIRRLGTNSAQIGDIVKVIDRIAEQTNLLALNAAIEAARAGEHGRGFAVVASEIRKLADGSVRATKEIAGHIGETQSVINQVTEQMSRLGERISESASNTDSASEALRDIVQAVLGANAQIAQISQVTRSMSDASFRVIRSIEEITRSVGANLAATSQMATHSGEVASAFEAIQGISTQNASSVEVLTYVNREVTEAATRIVSSVEEINARAAAMDERLARYTVADPVVGGVAP